jgi:hypothetical protein
MNAGSAGAGASNDVPADVVYDENKKND